MEKTQYAILRFAKYKGPEIGRIEAHNERTKENYASNPDIQTDRSKYNFHLIKPHEKYRLQVEHQITKAGCRTRKDSIRMVEALVTASPEFFANKKRNEIEEYFSHAMEFIKEHQDVKTFISAVVHMDEKTPHMHLCFVPMTNDNRLCAKEIIGNKKKLIWWQDEFWKHMVKKYPDLERGESASETCRDHIPPRIFKQMTRLNKQREKLDELLNGINPFNAKSRANEINRLLDSYIPAVEKMQTQLNKYRGTFTKTTSENVKLRQENIQLSKELKASQTESTLKKLKDAKLEQDYLAAIAVIEKITKEILTIYTKPIRQNEDIQYDKTKR